MISERTDSAFRKGTEATYGTMMSEGDMKSQSVIHQDTSLPSAFNSDYLRKGKPIRFTEDDSDDNTWVSSLFFSLS